MIDLEAIFGFGKILPIPEIIDFRLTKNLVDALGGLGTFWLENKMI